MSNRNIEKASEYIEKTKFAVLATTGKDGVPTVRTLGSFANDGLKVYFSTGKKTAKVEQIESNPNVTLLFQHEEQELPAFKNVSVTGIAKTISCESELNKAIQLLGNKSPRFKERAQKGELTDTLIFKVEPKILKYLDFSKGLGPDSVEEESL